MHNLWSGTKINWNWKVMYYNVGDVLQLSFAFMISTFISKSSSATTVGFAIFIIGFLTQVSILL